MADDKTADEVGIRRATMDYAEGWFEGNAERMARCLHPKSVKRALKVDPATGEKFINHLTKEDLVRFTQEGGGTDLARGKIYYKIDILDLFQEVAMVRCETYPYIDYLQLVKQEGQWLILNILYTAKPTA